MSDRIFRVLVRLLPEELRAGYAREMEATFRAERQEAATRRGGVARLWLATVVDLLRTGPREHLDILHRDCRFALRTMVARPIHSLSAVVTLALGIGANVAMFAVIDGVLLTPLPYRDPEALVWVGETARGGVPGTTGYLSFVDLRERARSFETLVAAGQSTATLVGDGRDAERVNAMRVSRAYFEMIGVQPRFGRAFTEAEDRPGTARRVVVVSDSLWRRRFNTDPSILGRTILIGSTPHQVVGVMPAGFTDLLADRLYQSAELWFPLGYDPAAAFACRTCRHLRVFGRLANGVTPSFAAREVTTLFAAMEQESPSQYHAAGAEVTPLAEMFLGPVRPVLLVLWGAVAVLLLVACSNVASLLLMRASERTQEIAVRRALGVSRSRIVRQLLTESLLLALVGALVALPVAWAGVSVIRATGPAELPRLADIAIDGRVLLAGLVLTIVSALVFGLAPLRQLLDRHATNALRGAGRRSESTRTWRMRSALVAVNVALAAILLVGSGLLVRSLANLLAVAPGIDANGVLTAKVWASGSRFSTGEAAQQIAAAVTFYDAVLARVRSLPGVSAAAGVSSLPLSSDRDSFGVHIIGRPHANPAEAPSADRFVVTGDFFSAIGIPLRRGRLINASDGPAAEAVVLINNEMAAALFPGEDPLGHRLALGLADAPPRTIVGVVDDVRHRGLDAALGYQAYVPHAQWAWAETTMTLLVRGAGDPSALAQPIREIVRTIDPNQPVTDTQRYETIVAATMATRRFAAWLLALFAAATLALAVVGLYGALSVLVEQRRREIAVRLALGAGTREIRWLVLLHGAKPVAMGLALGMLMAAASVGFLRTMLHQVGATDPLTFAAVPLLLASCATVACLVPALRASALQPATHLGGE